MAVTSLSAARWLKAYSTASSTAIGSVIATMNGMLSAKTSAMTVQGRPLPTSDPNFFAIWLSSMRLVSAVSAKRKGAASWRRRYELSRRTTANLITCKGLLKAWRVREERCSPALSVDPSSGCRGQFRAPSLDNQVNIRSTGVLGRRVHVNVDFDTEREYTSNNEVQIYYEGLQDEIVRRVDV